MSLNVGNLRNCNECQISNKNMSQGLINYSSKASKFNNGYLAKDTVSFSGKANLKNDLNIKIDNGFLGMGKRKISGQISSHEVDFVLDMNPLNGKVNLTGTIDGQDVNLSLKNNQMEGDLSDEFQDLVPQLRLLMLEKSAYDNEIYAACVAGSLA